MSFRKAAETKELFLNDEMNSRVKNKYNIVHTKSTEHFKARPSFSRHTVQGNTQAVIHNATIKILK